jgi:bifunctional non-homologous end joining protein LigD
VTLHGKKLEGGFVLIHSGKRSTNPSQRKRWLLIKHRDEYADDSFNIQNPELDHSALSGRTLDEIAAGKPTRKRKPSAA